MNLLTNPYDRLELRDTYWCLAALSPASHVWKRRSGNPAEQLVHNGYTPHEAIRDLGLRALSAEGKALLAQIAQREGIPFTGGAPRERRTYGPPLG